MEEIRSGEIPGGLHAGMEWIENRGLCASVDCLDSGFGGELRSSSDRYMCANGKVFPESSECTLKVKDCASSSIDLNKVCFRRVVSVL